MTAWMKILALIIQVGDGINRDILIMALLKEIDDYYLKLEPDESFQRPTPVLDDNIESIAVNSNPFYDGFKNDKDDNKRPSIAIKKKKRGKIKI